MARGIIVLVITIAHGVPLNACATAGSLRRSDSIQNNCRAGPRGRNRPKSAVAGRDRLRPSYRTRTDRDAREMQRAACQYDHLAGLPRARTRQCCSRRSSATRHWRRAAPRCSRRVEPAVRSARTQSTIDPASGETAVCAPMRSGPGVGINRFAARKLSRRERNFWMQRPGAKNRLRRTRTPAETENPR